MKSISHIIIILYLFITVCNASNNNETKDSIPGFGVETKSSFFFRERYLHNDFVNYLDNLDDYNTYQSETTGSFNLPDLLTFSISGNSFKWNKYYLDGFRIDNRIFPGSNFYQPDLYNHSLAIDYFRSIVSFNTDSSYSNSVALRYNIGGLGGISPGSKELIGSTTYERMYKPIEFRKKMKGAGSVFMNYNLALKGKSYKQQLYADFGTRMLVGYDETGINSYYPEDFSKVQLSGELPFKGWNLFDKTNYLFNFSKRQNLYTELNYSKDESAQNESYNFSFYGSKKNKSSYYTSGITLVSDKIRHNNLNFDRNLIDQDGEAFEPWYPDANTLELSHALNYSKKITSNLQLNFDSYNSIINFQPTQNNFQNQIYAKNVNMPFQSLYVYEWNSNPFTSGILENTLSLKADKQLSKSLNFKANLDLTFDGMVLSSKSMLRANWQGEIGLNFHPSNWFTMEIVLSRNRATYNFDDVRYFSNDYLNGNIYYWNDTNNDQIYQPEEKSDYFRSTGGKYHNAIENLKQQSYFVIDLPFYFRFGNNLISVLNTYKKYNNNWITRFDKPAEEYGYYETNGNKQIFFYNNGTVNYMVGYYPQEYMNTDSRFNFLTNSPFYYSNTIKYEYSNNKFLFSLSWTSFIMTGISTLGNGPLHNNIGVYSESTANPNNDYKIIGRLDQERAYVARILLSYKLNNNFSFALSGKFKDGQPFTSFDTMLESNGNSQLAIWNDRTKGINPYNGDFGSRKDSFFNTEIRTTYSGKISKYNYDLQLILYNVYDCGTELFEYSFEKGNINGRKVMEINIPRGLMVTGKFYF